MVRYAGWKHRHRDAIVQLISEGHTFGRTLSLKDSEIIFQKINESFNLITKLSNSKKNRKVLQQTFKRMRCAVEGCLNIESKYRFFLFPKDVELRERWMQFCRRTDYINAKQDRLCIEHFRESDLEGDLPDDLGVSNNPRPLYLKPGTVPSVYSNGGVSPIIENPGEADSHVLQPDANEKGHPAKQRKLIIVDDVLMECDQEQSQEIAHLDDPLPIKVDEEEDIDERPAEEVVQVVVVAEAYLEELEKENSQLRQENFKMKLSAQREAEAKEKLKHQLDTANACYNQLLGQLEKVFTKTQIHKLHCEKRIGWSKQEMKDNFALYAASPKAYSMLLQKGYPLPSTRILQQWEDVERARKQKNTPSMTLSSFEIDESHNLFEVVNLAPIDHNYVNERL